SGIPKRVNSSLTEYQHRFLPASKKRATMATTAVEFRPLAAAFGAEVIGVDLRDDLSEPVKHRLREAWYAHSLLLFRSQELSDEQVDRASEIFGRIEYQAEFSQRRRFISNVIEEGLNPYGDLGFHMDLSCSEKPLRGLSLYGVEVPPEGAGGNT